MDYEEKLQEAKRLYKTANSDQRYVLESLFPELKESEDERIRKALVRFHKSSIDIDGIKGEDILAWLEKQGEQKPIKMWHDVSEVPDEMQELLVEWESPDATWHDIAFYDAETKAFRHLKHPINNVTRWAYVSDILSQSVTKTSEQGWSDALEKQGEQKPVNDTDEDIVEAVKDMSILDMVEPKFKVGDWIVYYRNDSSREILYVYDIRDGRYYFNDNIHLSWSVKECDEKCHLWTIQDAKDGDVLCCESSGIEFIIILKQINNRSLDSYCRYNTIDGFAIDVPRVMSIQDNPKPATKEQRDLLFSKMKKAGYEWDAEKKKLSKRVIDEGKSEMDYCFTKMMNGEKVSPIWSEEDESILQGIWDEIMANKHDAKEYEWKTYDKFLDWLKSLKERIGG